jgi:nucleotidyltransferase substrate binding protein (TIGR01987 family)
MSTETRWRQRYANFQKAFLQLDKAVDINEYNDLEREGLIQRFEYTIELAWKTLQDLLAAKGYEDVKGPKPVIRQAFQDGYLLDGDAWLDMWESRLKSSHTYDEDTAIEIAENIKNTYYFLLDDLDKKLAKETIE